MARPLAEYLCPTGYHAPNLWSLAAEAHIVREAAQVMLRWPRPGRPDAAERELPVLLIPAFMAGDATLHRLAARLRQNGYRTFGSGMRANIGCAQAAGEALEHRLQTIVHRTEHPAAVVGHSLGGLLAKTLAHRRPDLVAGIVTLGSPLLAPAAIHQLLKWELILCHHLNRWGLDTLISADCTSGDCAQTSWQQLTEPSTQGER
jgi:triacylglycerol lipase